jgi:hypothetical protein
MRKKGARRFDLKEYWGNAGSEKRCGKSAGYKKPVQSNAALENPVSPFHPAPLLLV